MKRFRYQVVAIPPVAPVDKIQSVHKWSVAVKTLLSLDEAVYALADTITTVQMLAERSRHPLPIIKDRDKPVVDLRALIEWRQAETERLFRLTTVKG